MSEHKQNFIPERSKWIRYILQYSH